MQAVAAAESTASLLGDEVDKLKKEASQKLSDAVRPLQKRIEKLESSAKTRVCAPFFGTATMPARHFLQCCDKASVLAVHNLTHD